jgi:hypothetical protein
MRICPCSRVQEKKQKNAHVVVAPSPMRPVVGNFTAEVHLNLRTAKNATNRTERRKKQLMRTPWGKKRPANQAHPPRRRHVAAASSFLFYLKHHCVSSRLQ